MIKKSIIKNCCGSSSYLLELDIPLTKSLHDYCLTNGYQPSPMYDKVGVFFVNKNQLTASGSFGGKKLQAKVPKTFAEQAINDLILIIENFSKLQLPDNK
jgi:hypothetical protein